ncbi:feline leukemia virus subgroup C receptor-related 1 [Brachionus plicatilis]|uniref:Feline leukemia virus subgroup C receptor-related 1 n=1 Tax=Brachionus plicatilis TaxID=10195 RepID=A0A3M7S8A8_BRAPC|nr:feline leukemia virus subgroup C receptor-related 1 [Brachionus plicatilis]
MTTNGISGYFDVDVKSEFDPNEKVKNSDSINDMDSSVKPFLYTRRWIILTIFILISILNSLHLNLYSEIPNVMVSVYHPGDSNDKSSQYNMINWLSIVHLVSNIVFVIPVILLNDCLGFRCCCLLGASLGTIGSWIKYSSIKPVVYEVLLFGQIVCSVSQTFISICLIRLSGVWFGRNEVATTISVGVLSSKIGHLVSFVMVPYLISKYNSHEMNIYYFDIIYLTVSALLSLLSILSLILVRDYPEKCPSFAQIEIRNNQKTLLSINYREKFVQSWVSMSKIWSKQSYVFVAVSHAFLIGSMYSITYLLNQILYANYFQENSTKIGIIELFLIISSILGFISSGLLIDFTKSFKILTVISYVITFISTVAFTTTINLDIWFPFCTIFFLGFFSGFYLPASYEYAIERTYPVSESTSCGFLIFISSITGIAMTYTYAFIILNFGVFYGNCFLCVLQLIGMILTSLISTEYKRERVNLDKRSHHEIDNRLKMTPKKLRN